MCLSDHINQNLGERSTENEFHAVGGILERRAMYDIDDFPTVIAAIMLKC